MPIFEYKCEKCGNIFEVLALGSENDKKIICPKCNSEKVKKMLNPPTLVFKGPGFYATEYGKQKANKNPKNGSSNSSSKENSSASNTTPTAKKESKKSE